MALTPNHNVAMEFIREPPFFRMRDGVFILLTENIAWKTSGADYRIMLCRASVSILGRPVPPAGPGFPVLPSK
jgi:hypothetical protein